MKKNYFIHPTAIVDTDKIGEKTRIWAFTHILDKVQIGKDCNICDHCFIENNVVIGDRVTIKCGAYIWDGISIEDDVFVGPNVTFTNDNKPRSKAYLAKYPKTLLKKGSSIGANATILAGLVIGESAMVGAGSVVTKDVPDFTLVYGNPAKFGSYICKCGKNFKLKKDKALCRCGIEYHFNGNNIVEIK